MKQATSAYNHVSSILKHTSSLNIPIYGTAKVGIEYLSLRVCLAITNTNSDLPELQVPLLWQSTGCLTRSYTRGIWEVFMGISAYFMRSDVHRSVYIMYCTNRLRGRRWHLPEMKWTKQPAGTKTPSVQAGQTTFLSAKQYELNRTGKTTPSKWNNQVQSTVHSKPKKTI